MSEGRLGLAEAAVEQDLTGCAEDEVGAADDLVDPHRTVIDHHGKLIGRSYAVPCHEEVAARPLRLQFHPAPEQVVPGDGPRRHAEPPGEGTIAQACAP